MNNPLVSVIIPVYNAEKYLAETITCAINQTWVNKEIIIVDDGSADTSLAIAQSFANDQIKVFSQPNKGASAARNKGLLEAKGDYIQFLDADDLLMPNKIARQVQQLIDKPNTLAICPMADFYNPADIAAIPLQTQLQSIIADKLQFLLSIYDMENKTTVPIHAWLTPASVIKKANLWNESLTVNDDGEFFCRVVLAANGVIAVNDTLCYYRKYKGLGKSLSGKKDLASLQSQYHSLLLIDEHLKKANNHDAINKVIAQNMAALLVQAYPAHKKLVKHITQKIKELGGTHYIPVLGGTTIEFIKKLFGWKTARLLQFYLYKISKN
ncbi:MAG: glycosyltransferase family 2 protein [Mucilaginibacter sp.]